MKDNYIKTVFRHIIIWTLAFLVFNFIRENGQEINRSVEEANHISILERLLFQLILGIVSGILFGSYQFLFKKYRKKNLTLGQLIFYGSLGYAGVIFVFILLAFLVFGTVFSADIDRQIIKQYFTSGEALAPLLFCFIMGFLIEFFQEVDKKFGPGNLKKMLTGKFYKPQVEERIFMFLDMKSSTTIAEKLGHIKYSRLIQDCFKDISVVADYNAEIYQYVGDEAVLTWEVEAGVYKDNCIRAYFAFVSRLKSKAHYYQEAYDVVPHFKAGMHRGVITVAEVGEIKREIAYHGDTINTAARIQSKCNDYGKSLLVSEKVIEDLSSPDDWKIMKEGEVELRGKTLPTSIYSIEN